MGESSKIHTLKHVVGYSVRLFFALAHGFGADRRFVTHAGCDELVFRLLEHHADPSEQIPTFPSEDVVLPTCGNHGLIHAHTAGNRLEQAGQSQRERGFSHAVFAGQCGDLASMEHEVHMLAKREVTPEAEILRSQNNISRRLAGFGGMTFDGASWNPCAALCEHRCHAAEHFFRSAVCDDAADMRVGLRLAEYDNPIHQIKPYVNMVFHHHQGFTGLFQHMAYRIMHFLDALRIEVGRRFVEQQQSGMHGEHAGQGQTLAAGQSACGAVKFHVAESNNVERGTDPAPNLIFRQIQIFTTESGVIAHTFQNRLRIGILQYQS